MARNCLLLLLLCIANPLFSQSRYTYFEYTTENGLPSNGSKGMYFDSTTGFLWLATEAGLARFNGSEFKLFNEGNQDKVITDRMLFLFRNSDGDIYTEDAAARLFRIRKQLPVLVKDNNKFANAIESTYLLYVSQRMFDSWFHKQQKPSIDMFLIFTKVLALSDTSALVIGGQDSSLYYFSVSNSDPKPVPLPVKHFADFFRIGNQSFLLDADKNIYEFDASTKGIKKIKPGFPGLRTDLIFWQPGTKNPIYISGTNAFTLRLENGVLQRDIVCDSLPRGVEIKFIQYDRAVKTLFIATVSRGLLIVRENSVEAVRRPEHDATIPESYYTQLLLPNGNIQVNSGQQLGKAAMMPHMPISGRFGNYIYNDGDSVTWYTNLIRSRGNYTFLHSYHAYTGKTTIYPKSSISPITPPIHKSGGKIYLFTPKGLYMLQHDSLVLIDPRFCPPEDMPSDLTELSPGLLALATRDYVFLYNTATKKADTILVNKTVAIRTLWVYMDYLFIGTYGGGIYIHHNGKTKAIPVDKNRRLLFAHCFIKDEYGYCWISSNSGLFKARLSDMIHAFENDHTASTVIYYHYYGKNDGMAITEMNGGCSPCAIERQDKIISFPTMLGLLWVNPAFAKPGVLWNDIYIDAFSANRINIHPDSLQYEELASNTREIRLKIAYPVWENPENVYIQYRFNDDSTWKWLEPGGNIVFNNPGHGKHTIQVRKINGFDENNITLTDISFTIARPVYATWWFYTLVGLTALGLIYLYIRLRTRQYILRQRKLEALIAEKTKELKEQNVELEKRDRIKTRLISIINHDIITPLKFLAATGKTLREKRNMMNEKVQDETINEMVNTSKELHVLSTNILNWIKYQSEGKGLVKEYFPLHELVNDILKVLNPMAHLKHLKTVNNIDPQFRIYQYYDPLKVLVYNLVSNSIKFTPRGTIVIGAEKTTRRDVTIWVSDQGIGMTDKQVENLLMGKTNIHSAKDNPGAGHGLGYQIIRDLLNITGALIAIESEQGKGTTVLIRFANEPDTAPGKS